MVEKKIQHISEKEIDIIARSVHNQWAKGRIAEGWKYGIKRDDDKKEHPTLVAYEQLSESEKEYDRQTVKATIGWLLENGYDICKITE